MVEPSKVDDIFAEMAADSDRAVIITLSSWAENALGTALLHKMRELSTSEEDALFGINGPLRSFSAKINIAYAQSLIGPQTKRDLHVIRELRNTAAHARRPVSFDIPEIIAATELLSGIARAKKAGICNSPKQRRQTFAYFVIMLTERILKAESDVWFDVLRDHYLP